MSFVKINTFFDEWELISDKRLAEGRVNIEAEHLYNVDSIMRITTHPLGDRCEISLVDGSTRFCKDFKTKEDLLNNIMTQLHSQKFNDKLNKIVEE